MNEQHYTHNKEKKHESNLCGYNLIYHKIHVLSVSQIYNQLGLLRK